MDLLTYPIRGDKLSMTVSITERVHKRQTEFQEIEIVDTDVFGRMLLLDGHVQLAEMDEHAYHEALVHIPMLSIPEPKRALVVGGGDGGVVRELARHDSLKEIHMVEIDKGVIEACSEHMSSLNNGAFRDPRLTLRIEDAFPFVKGATEPYDMIVLDSTDVYEGEDGNLSEALFTRVFYSDIRRLLSDKGMVVTQADNLVFCPYSMESIIEEFAAVFPHVGAYQALIPSFGGYSGYVWASGGATPAAVFPLERAVPLGLRYLTATTWALAFENLSFGPLIAADLLTR